MKEKTDSYYSLRWYTFQILWWGTFRLLFTVDDNTKTIGGIKVLRAIARVDVVVGENVDNFKLKGVYIYNTKTRGYVAPDPNNINASLQAIKAQVPPANASMPHNDYDSSNPNAKALVYTIPDANSALFEREIYLLEAAAVAETERDKATCLVIGGEYNNSGETTWYRVDLFEDIKDAEGNITEQKYKDFLRNHQYRFNITNVKGPGHPEPEIAFKEKTVNMIAEIKEWDDGAVGDIFFDGQNYISVNPGTELYFTKEAGFRMDTIKTDVEAGFKITGITYDENNSSDWISIDQALNTSLGKGEVEVPVKIDVTENTEGKERIGYIHVEAGRLRLKIKVTQSITTKAVFEFISMKNVDGQGLAIPRAGGIITTTVKSNIKWKIKALRGNNPIFEIESEEPTSEAIENSIDLDIDPLNRYWKDEQQMDTHSDVWIEYEQNGETIVAQKATFYQVPYDIKPKNSIPQTINKYGDFLELELQGYYPGMPVRVIDQEGNYVSDIAALLQTGDILNVDNFSSKIKFLVYSNYSGSIRDLQIQYYRPVLTGGDANGRKWETLATVSQEYNGLTLPTTGYKATRGVLGIGAKTGKLRLDGSHGLYGGTATYIDQNGIEQPEDVYMVCFMWGSLVGLHAPMLDNTTDYILVASDESYKELSEIIAWLPPGFQGDIDLTQSYMDLVPFNELHLLSENNLTTGYGDPCRSAKDETASTYGSYRMPWGVGGGNHEAFNSYWNPKPELQNTGDGKDYYFLKNSYYENPDPLRQYISAYGLIT